MHEIRVLTVRQPYASAIFFGLSPKDVENRSKPPPRGLIGQVLHIHAGEGIDVPGFIIARNLGFNPLGLNGDPTPADVRAALRGFGESMRRLHLPHGAILGSVVLAGVEPAESKSPWRDGSVTHGWTLRDPRPLREPIYVPSGGSVTHGWRPTDEIADLIFAQEHGRAA